MSSYARFDLPPPRLSTPTASGDTLPRTFRSRPPLPSPNFSTNAPTHRQGFSLVPPQAGATGIYLVNIQSASEQSGGSLWHVDGDEISPFPLPLDNPVVAVGMVASKKTPLLVTVDGRSLILPDQGTSAPVTSIKPSRGSSAAVGGAGFNFGGRNMSAAPPPTPAATRVQTIEPGDADAEHELSTSPGTKLGEFKNHLLSAFRQRDESWARQTNTLAPILSQFHLAAPDVVAARTLNVAVCQLSRAEVNAQMDGSRLLRHWLDHKQRMHKTFLDYLRQHEVLWEQIDYHTRLTLLEHGEALATAAALADYQAKLLQKREKRTPVLRRGIEKAVQDDPLYNRDALWKAGLSEEDVFYGRPNLASDPRADHLSEEKDASTAPPGFNLIEGLKQAGAIAAFEAAQTGDNFEDAMNLFLDAAIAIETALTAAKRYREEEAELYGLECDSQVPWSLVPWSNSRFNLHVKYASCLTTLYSSPMNTFTPHSAPKRVA